MAERPCRRSAGLFVSFLRSMGRAVKIEEGGRMTDLWAFAYRLEDRREIRESYPT